MKKTQWICAIIALLLALGGGAYAQATEADKAYLDYVNTGKRFGVQAGDVMGDIAQAYFQATPEDVFEYQTIPDLLAALEQGRIDAIFLLDDLLAQLKEDSAFESLTYIRLPEEVYVKKAAPVFATEELRDTYNAWLADLKADGTWQEICDFWMGGPLPADEDIPRHELSGENGTLIMADTGNYPPLTYVGADGELTGFDVDLMGRFAQHLGMDVEYQLMSYDGLIPYVLSGKADMSAATITITEERVEGVLFGDPTTINSSILIVPKSAVNVLPSTEAFKGSRFAVLTGSIYDQIAESHFNASEKLYYATVLDELSAVNLGKADCALLDQIIATAQLRMGGEELADLIAIPVEDESLDVQYGMFSMNQAIIDEYNAFLADIQAEGVYDAMYERWVTNFSEDTPAPEIPLAGEKGTLRFAINGAFPPFSFLGPGGAWSGFDIEQIALFAQRQGYALEIIDMDFSAMIPYIVSERADLGSSIYITEERAQSVLFSNPSAQCPTVLVTRESHALSLATGQEAQGGGEGTGFSFITWLQEGVQRNLIAENRYMMIVNGLLTTMQIALAAQLLGTLLGCLVCFLLMRKNILARGVAYLYNWLIHGTPIVVLLMIAYYIIWGKSDIPAEYIAIAAFTLVEGAVIGGQLQLAISTVDPVEIEAARSMGFSSVGAFFTVTLPQAIKVALPGYMNGFVELVKATAIVGYIAIQDLSRAADIIRSRTYDPYFPLLLIAVIYLLVTTLCVQLFKAIVRRISK